MSVLVVMCRLWRWPDLEESIWHTSSTISSSISTSSSSLVPLPACLLGREGQDGMECCNPYHWAREAKPGKIYLVVLH